MEGFRALEVTSEPSQSFLGSIVPYWRGECQHAPGANMPRSPLQDAIGGFDEPPPLYDAINFSKVQPRPHLTIRRPVQNIEESTCYSEPGKFARVSRSPERVAVFACTESNESLESFHLL